MRSRGKGTVRRGNFHGKDKWFCMDRTLSEMWKVAGAKSSPGYLSLATADILDLKFCFCNYPVHL